MLYLLIAGVYKVAFLPTTPGGNIIKLLGKKIESGRREGKEKGRKGTEEEGKGKGRQRGKEGKREGKEKRIGREWGE